MCLAVPGKVLSVEGFDPAFRSGCVDFCGVRKTVNLAFTPEVEPGTGKSIVAHVEASAPCILVVAALNQRDGQLAYGWRPQFVELDEEWQEVMLPQKSTVWRWEQKGEPFDFYVLIMPAGSPATTQEPITGCTPSNVGSGQSSW